MQLGQLGVVMSLAVNEPKKLAERLPQIAPLADGDDPARRRAAVARAGGFANAEAVSEDDDGGFVRGWWQNPG